MRHDVDQQLDEEENASNSTYYFLGSFLDIRALSLVLLPPSQNPLPFFPTSNA